MNTRWYSKFIISLVTSLFTISLFTNTALAIFNNGSNTYVQQDDSSLNALVLQTSTLSIVSNSSWRVSNTPASGWQTADFDDSSWEFTIAPAPQNCGWVNPYNPEALTMWSSVQYQTIYLRKSFFLESISSVISATIQTASDDDHDLYINGTLVASDWDGFAGPFLTTNIKAVLRPGNNVIAVKVNDTAGGCRWMSIDATIVSDLHFLDLPFQYTNFSDAAKGSNSGGYVNSWFDHETPNYQKDGFILRWDGVRTPDPLNVPCTFGSNCYDGHNGIDFQSQKGKTVYAAAPGIVVDLCNNYPCAHPLGVLTSDSSYGKWVLISHGSNYATFYAHLDSINTNLGIGTEITDTQVLPVGTVGGTGGHPPHLHFGVYYDANGNGKWEETYQGYTEAIDPYGYQGANYLWIHPYDNSPQQSINSSGGSVSTPSGNLAVTVPAGAVVNPITLELWNTPPVAGASATLRSSGNSFWMRVLEWLSGGSSPSRTANDSMNMANTATNSFDLPVTVTLHYDSLSMPHLDTSQLTIKQWDDVGLAWVTLPTTLDAVNEEASAQTSQPGHFDLQAPLICPVDTLEPNDNYDGSSITQVNGALVDNLFDIATDEDWFKFDAITGNEYVIQTTGLSSGVDTVLEIYDTDGITLLASNDNSGIGNSSSLTWQALQDGLYFARVIQASGSSFGCNVTYNFSVTMVDSISPTVNTFTATSPSNSLNISITDFTTSDLVGVTGYLVTESATPPAVDDLGWTGAAPTVYTVISDGSYTLYPWAKDAAGNISSVFASPPAVVVDTTKPIVDTFTVETPSATLNIPITGFTASDNNGVTGYLITTSSTPPAVGDTGWTDTIPTIFTVASSGSYTLYPWAIDSAGNVSAVFSSSPVVVVDNTKPTVNTFTAATPSNSFNIPITAFTASDNFGVTGYLITTSATPPAADIPGWNDEVPATYTVSNIGNFTLYPWAKDALGNVSDVFTSPRTVLVDLPIVQSISRSAPNPTKAASVTFAVIFSKPVTGVDKADFVVAGGIPKAAITKVSGSGSIYTVTVKTGTGSGTVHLNLFDNDSVKDASLIPLGGDGAVNGDFTSGDTYTIDKTKPTVLSITRADASPTELASVNFLVTFSEPVTGVDAKDFKLIGTGSLAKSKPVVTGVVGSGTTYTVTATTGTSTAPGTMRLDLMANKTIKDPALNLLTTSFKTGLPYAVDKPPVVVSINRSNPNPTKLATVKFTVKFSEAVTGVDAGDFNLPTTLTGISIVSITGSGTTWVVIVNAGTGSGTLGLNLDDNDSILDTSGKPLGGAGLGNGNYTGQVYNVR